MASQFDEFAERDNIHPQHNLSDTSRESFEKALADFRQRGGRWFYPDTASNIPQAIAPPVAFRDFTLTADVVLDNSKASGPVFAYGGQLGGIGLYIDKGKPVFIVNSLDGQSSSAAARKSIGDNKVNLQLDVKKVTQRETFSHYAVTLVANDETLIDTTIDRPIPLYFGIPETFGVGRDEGSPVLKGYIAGTPFAGELSNVEFVFPGSAESGGWVH